MDISLIGQCMLKTRLSNVLMHLNIRFVSNVVSVCVCVCVLWIYWAGYISALLSLKIILRLLWLFSLFLISFFPLSWFPIACILNYFALFYTSLTLCSLLLSIFVWIVFIDLPSSSLIFFFPLLMFSICTQVNFSLETFSTVEFAFVCFLRNNFYFSFEVP